MPYTKNKCSFFNDKDCVLYSRYNFIHCDLVTFAFENRKKLPDILSFFIILFYKVQYGNRPINK